MKSSELSRSQLIRMIGVLRGLSYSLMFDLEDSLSGDKPSPEMRYVSGDEFHKIIDETSFDVDEDTDE